ncbi:MAG: phosphatidate cytidylyltransferase [Mycoplasmataceae bacterium]|nr:phosphatidate cytidylyltransferase [Mycoplasmataceae bacterium]
MNIRVRSGVLMAVYGLILIYIFSLTDKTSDGWASYLPADIHNYISFSFAIFSVLSVSWIIIFAAKELHYCFINNNSKKQIIFLAISMLLIQLVPTLIWMIPNYFDIPMHDKQPLIWFLCFFISGIVIALICLPIYIKMVKGGKKNNKFNLIVFPLTAIGIAVAFGCIYYLCIVRYWGTTIIILLSVCGCDMMAYFTGVLFAKHKLAPVISPKKSWEGAILGSIITASLAVLFIYLSTFIHHGDFTSKDIPYNFFGIQFLSAVDWYKGPVWWILVVVLAMLLTFFTIVGDLIFSLIKRRNNIKDFGRSIPGHGGYLDRIDSFVVVVFTFTVVMFLTSLVTAIYNNIKWHDFQGFRTIFPCWNWLSN